MAKNIDGVHPHPAGAVKTAPAVKHALIAPAESTDLPDENAELTADVEAAASEPMLAPSKKVVIKPLHDAIAPEEPVPAPAASEPEAKVDPDPAPAAATSKSNTDAETITVSVVPKGTKTETADAAAAPVAVAETADLTPPAEAETETEVKEAPEPSPAAVPAADNDGPEEAVVAADAAAEKVRKEHEAQLNKLVQSQQYFVPIKTVRQRRARRALWLVPLIIILLVAAADLALDDGLVTNTHNLPHTSFFKK